MDKLNLPFFYQLGVNLDPVTNLIIPPGNVAVTNRLDLIIKCVSVRGDLAVLFSTFPTLSVCRAVAGELEAAIQAVIESFMAVPLEKRGEPDATVDARINQTVDKARVFKTVLIAELQTLAAYHVTEKSIYSTAALIERAENVLPKYIRDELSPETREDINQAGRCLAFDLPTASGFHTWRAVETVLVSYSQDFGATPKRRDWGSYIAALKAVNADPKTLAILDQIRDLHRNPTMHPEVVLSIDEATGLFGIAPSAIVAMVTDILRHRGSTQPTSASQAGTGSNAP